MSPSYLLLTCRSAMETLKQSVDSYSDQTFLDIPERMLLSTSNPAGIIAMLEQCKKNPMQILRRSRILYFHVVAELMYIMYHVSFKTVC